MPECVDVATLSGAVVDVVVDVVAVVDETGEPSGVVVWTLPPPFVVDEEPADLSVVGVSTPTAVVVLVCPPEGVVVTMAVAVVV